MFYSVAFIIIYTLIGIITKSYYKVYRWGEILPEIPIITGVIWPLYWLFRLSTLAILPVIWFSNLLENKMIERQTEQKTKEYYREIKKVKSRVDPIMQEAEQEVEDTLTKDEYRSL